MSDHGFVHNADFVTALMWKIEDNEKTIAILRKDAERYRWLQTNRLAANNGILFFKAMGWKPKMLDATGVDAAIDAAMKEEGK
tara:strand:- start:1023 stop:1271 length:249 start_codon:yes stop_codon:yes gene_type:complete